jgi:hypothetical protein
VKNLYGLLENVLVKNPYFYECTAGRFSAPFIALYCFFPVYSALENIEKRGILPGYNFSVTFVDTGCKARAGLGE